MAKPKPNVTRWAYLIDQAWKKKGRHAPSFTPMSLGQIHKESAGRPDVRHPKSNAIGLGQQFAWIKGKGRYFGVKRGGKYHPPYVHPKGQIIGYPVSWDPHDQINALVGVVHHHLKRNTTGHLPSAVLAYASGPGAVKDFVSGEPDRHDKIQGHVNVYLPLLAKRWDEYSAWYDGWVKAGRPTYEGEVESGDGKTYKVIFAKHEVGMGEPYESPFDGRLVFKGKSVPTGPSGSGGKNPSEVTQAEAAKGGAGSMLVTAGITAAALGALYAGIKAVT